MLADPLILEHALLVLPQRASYEHLQSPNHEADVMRKATAFCDFIGTDSAWDTEIAASRHSKPGSVEAGKSSKLLDTVSNFPHSSPISPSSGR
jgi:hypothetical protein